MFQKFKRAFYFTFASYFRFFAKIRLQKWQPRIIVVTGSNGKTTLLHMLEAQIGNRAKYSHHANSSFGIPFDILGLKRTTLQKTEWISLILKAPLQVFSPVPRQNIYVVEADCDRPYEGNFLAAFLKPEVVLWVSTAKTHSMNFDRLVTAGKFKSVEEAIAYEYGYFLEYATKMVIIDADSELEKKQTSRTKAMLHEISLSSQLKQYSINNKGTTFQMKDGTYTFEALLPREAALACAMTREITDYLAIPFDAQFTKFVMPAGRGSIFAGIKDTMILDSSYNLSPASLAAILVMYNTMQVRNKWLVIGDLLELGKSEREEHEKIAKILADSTFERIILMGPRVKKYTYPVLKSLLTNKVHLDAFESPKEVLDFLEENLKGGETILFKGARFMEGIIEHLLKNKSDVAKLARREKIWQLRRKQWGL